MGSSTAFRSSLRRGPSDPNDVLYRVAARAAAVVTDDYPTFIAARHNAGVAPKLGIAFYAVDASCIVPMACFRKREYAAYTIRPKIHMRLPEYLWPAPPVKVHKRFPERAFEFHTPVSSANIGALIAACQIIPAKRGRSRMACPGCLLWKKSLTLAKFRASWSVGPWGNGL